MNKAACALALGVALAGASGAGAMEQGARIEQGTPRPAEDVGVALAAASINLVYFPVRFALTTVTAVGGGLTGWLTGGDGESAQGVWNSTDGQAFITPRILQGRERLRFGGAQ